MQDRFKFRVWCKECKEWEKDQVAITNKENYIINFSNQNFTRVTNIDPVQHEINFCTGLKDKNGKLIYEGDIVKIEYYDFEIKHRIGIVEWEDDGFCITYHNPKDTKVSGCSLVDIVNGDKQEVIGNIYENPELLELKNE